MIRGGQRNNNRPKLSGPYGSKHVGSGFTSELGWAVAKKWVHLDCVGRLRVGWKDPSKSEPNRELYTYL